MSGKKILIITGGSIDDDLAKGLLAENSYETVIACDSGMEFFYRNGLHPDLILGDFDSADPETVAYFKKQQTVKLEQFPAEKDWTDTELAVRRALELNPAHIDLAGATGSRLDHVLGNVQLLAMGLSAGVSIHMLDSHNRIRLTDTPCTIAKCDQYGTFVSLLPFGGTAYGVTLHGMKYPLDQATLTPDITLGISNEIVDELAEISFTAGRLLVIESRD